MEKNKKELRGWGSVLLVFALCDAMTLASSLMEEGGMFTTIAEYSDPLVSKIAMFIAGAALGINAIVLVLQAFIGFKGMQLSKKPTAAAGHIRIAKILAVFQVILAVSAVFSLFNAKISVWGILDVVVCVASVGILLFYVKYAKAVREDFLKAK